MDENKMKESIELNHKLNLVNKELNLFMNYCIQKIEGLNEKNFETLLYGILQSVIGHMFMHCDNRDHAMWLIDKAIDTNIKGKPIEDV